MINYWKPRVLLNEDLDEGGTIADEVENTSSSDVADAVFEGDAFVADPDKGVTKVKTDEQQQTSQQEPVSKKSSTITKLGQKQSEILEDDSGETAEGQDTKVVEVDDEAHADEKAKPRNYEGLTETDIAFLKKQPNAVYSALTPVLKEKYKVEAKAKELETQLSQLKADPNRIPENWYENEQAFQLTPEYKQLNGLYSRYQEEGRHWSKQMARINRGAATWNAIIWNPKTGSYQDGPEQAVPETDEAKDNLVAEMDNASKQASAQMASLQAKADSLQEGFKNQHQGYNTYYDEAMDARFSKMHKDIMPKKEHEDQLYAIMHPSDKGRGIAKVAAKLFSVAINQASVIKALQGQASTNKIIGQDRKIAGPPNKTSLTSSNGNGRPTIGKNGKLEKGAVIDFEELSKDMTEE